MSHFPQPPPDPDDPYRPPFQSDPFAQPGTPPVGQPYDGPPPGAMVPYEQGPQTGGYEAPYTAVPANDPVLTTIGDISISQYSVTTPSGRFPIKGTTWTATDMSHTTQSISTTGIVLTVLSLAVFIWACGLGLFGLLFLLMKEEKTTGHVQVTVQANGMFHSTMVPVQNRNTITQVLQSVNYARSLAAS